jgi:sugar lactone lactonase YvrE
VGRFLAVAGLGLLPVLACEAGVGADPHACIADAGPRLVLTTTDHSTGALTVIDVDDRCVQRDVALASTDAIPFVHEGLVYSINRYAADYVDVFDPADDWRLVREQAITAGGTESPNPRSLAIAADGLAYVALYGAPQVQVLDLEAGDKVGEIDLTEFADADGTTEAPLVVVHGEEVFVFVERLDRTDGWAPVDDDILLVVDIETRALVDLDLDAEGVQGLPLLGRWPRQWRSLPDAPGQGLVLGTGIQRVDLVNRSTEWVIDEQAMAAVGIDDPELPQSFDIDADGRIYVAAYESGFEQVRIFRSGADGEPPLEPLVEGLHAIERSLEIVGDEIWFGDTTPGAPGVRVFSLDGDAIVDVPLPTGLPPYAMVRLE